LDINLFRESGLSGLTLFRDRAKILPEFRIVLERKLESLDFMGLFPEEGLTT
jgi:hypothetical protein